MMNEMPETDQHVFDATNKVFQVLLPLSDEARRRVVMASIHTFAITGIALDTSG